MRLSLFFFLHLVAFVILLIVHPHARANDGWTIEKDNKRYSDITASFITKAFNIPHTCIRE